MLTISIYDGEYTGDLDALTHLCDVEGSVEPYDRPPFSVVEEVRRVLELCEERYSTPPLRGTGFTVFVGSKADGQVTPLLRLDGYARNGWASAGVVGAPPRWDMVPAKYTPDDDVVTIVRKMLAAQLPR